MIRKQTRSVRCAIYTRKSTEEGLEQEFNSLDAQREAGEAYIESQRHEGWTCCTGRYDDGGYTGANMDRPALRRLLTDIEAGQVDCVVVYKVDRISRSLLDFAQIMETFERHQVAFVSVTQGFNTGSSMGRLILNVLLSFAQFEREMISERTRDKIAAARRKGKWSGGMPVLGYTVVQSKLVVDEGEAERVRQIFQWYLEHQSLLAVVQQLNQRNWRTKRWTTKKGKTRGGVRFTKTKLYHLLTNPVYLGQVKYKDEVHEGEHAAIVEKEVFARVQTLLRRNGRNGGSAVRNKHGALLRGLLRCAACDCGMSHSFTAKGNRRYRYYVCQRAQQQGWQECPCPSVPAGEIERFVVEQIQCVGRDPRLIRETLAQARVQMEQQLESLHAERSEFRDQLREAHAELGRLTATCPPGDPRLADVQDAITEGTRHLAQIDRELERLQGDRAEEAEVAAALADFDGVWDGLTPREQARVIGLLVAGVVYDGMQGKIAITFRDGGIPSLAETLQEQTVEAA